MSREVKGQGTNSDGYLGIVERTPQNFSAYSPDLPGCVSTGPSEEEVLRNMQEAMRFHLDGSQWTRVPDSYITVLRELGQAGWELVPVNTSADSSGLAAVFKRPVL